LTPQTKSFIILVVFRRGV